jgi:protein archease
MGHYRFVEDVAIADCAIDLEGRDLGDLFDAAAEALARVMVDPATVRPTVEREVALAAPTVDLLLYDWLSELIFLKDRDRQVFTRSEARVTDGTPCELTACVVGGAIEPGATRSAPIPRR